MKINWFPGHMHKALKDISENLKKVDVVTYVLDARIPLSSINPSLDKLTENKPVLYIFNKIDLADEGKIEAILPQFKQEKCDYVCFNSTGSGKSDVIVSKIKNLAKAKIEKYRSKGVKATVRTMVVGIPNCGKSTLVNNLCKKAKTMTGDRAGITKRGQWLNVGDCVEIYDTPGTLYPNIENQEVAKKLAYVGSVRDEILDFVELGNEFLQLLSKLYPNLSEKRFGGASSLEEVASQRKLVGFGGQLDLERAGKTVIEDFRKGRIGRLTLD